MTDPESHEWDPLDGELAHKLDQRRYVSLSRDRKLAAEGTPTAAEEPAIDAEVNDEEVSLFDLHMPGVLTVEEVEALDLDHWLLLVHGSFVHMIVSDHCLARLLLVGYIYIYISQYKCLCAILTGWAWTGSRWVGEYADDESSIGEGDYGGVGGRVGAEGCQGECGGIVRLGFWAICMHGVSVLEFTVRGLWRCHIVPLDFYQVVYTCMYVD